MASYSNYKKVTTEQIADGLVTDDMIVPGARKNYGIKWVYGSPNVLASGCCCNWTVPSGVSKLFFEIWGAGGNGHGSCSWDRCQHFKGAGGGQYNSKMINTAPGCQYTVCAAGVYPCCSLGCTGCEGCSSYVNGYNLSNFCAHGGARGCANADWSIACTSRHWCCVSPGTWGGDFAMVGHQDGFSGHWNCHCTGDVNNTCSTGAPFLVASTENQLDQCWIRCGCWTAPYATGGMSAMTTYCGSGHCGQGGQGGSGMVRITYV